MIYKMQIAYYNPRVFGEPTKFMALREAISIFSSSDIKLKTETIRSRFRYQIQNDFKDCNKTPYQELKKALLPSVTFSGTISRSTGTGDFTGLVTVDLDNNDPALLDAYYQSIPNFCFAWGWSVSGAPNGFSVFKTPARNKEEYEFFALAIQEYLKVEFKLVTALSDYKRVRYISYNESLHVCWDCEELSRDHAQGLINEMQKEAAGRSKVGDSIVETEWVAFCEEYANRSGYDFIPGQRHLYLNRFSIAANLLGVPQEKCEAHLLHAYGFVGETDACSYPYAAYKESHNNWGWRLSHQEEEGYALPPNQYISDLDIDFCGKILHAGTGTGKTYAAVTLRDRVILAVPYYALCENIASEYKIGAYSGIRKISDQPDKIVTTYASLRSLTRHLGDAAKDYHLIVDEAHNMTLSASRGFMLDDLNYIAHTMEQGIFSSTTFLSGTWLYNIHPLIQEMEIVRVKKERPEKPLTYIRGESTLQVAVEVVKEKIQAGRFPFVLQNDTSMNRATLMGHLEAYNVKSFTSRSKTDKDFLSIVKDSYILPGIDAIISTTVLKEGNNINNEIDISVIIVGNYHSSEIEQVSQRFRKAKSIEVIIIKPTNGVRSAEWGDARQFTWIEQEKAKLDLKTLGQVSKMQERVRRMFDAFPFRFEDEDNPTLDYLMLSQMGVGIEKILENRNQELQCANLSQYGIIYQAEEQRSGKLKEDEYTKELKETIKKTKEANYKDRITALRLNPRPLAIAKEMERFNSHKLKPGEDIAIRYFIKMAKYHDPKVVLNYMVEMPAVKNKLKKLERYFLFNAVYHISLVRDTKEHKFIDMIIKEMPDEPTLVDCAYLIHNIGRHIGIGTSNISKEILKWETSEGSPSNVFRTTRGLVESIFEIESFRALDDDRSKVTKYRLVPRKRIPYRGEKDDNKILKEFTKYN